MTQYEMWLDKLQTRFVNVDPIEIPRGLLIEILQKAIGFDRILTLPSTTLYNIPSLLETISKMDES